MSFPDLRGFISFLEKRNDLIRIKVPVSADQEITIIQHRVLAAGGPALLFENVEGSPYRLISNLFGTKSRVEAVFGTAPAELGERLAGLAERLMPPSIDSFWSSRRDLMFLTNARLKTVRSGPILEKEFTPPNLTKLPCLTCWPLDGGPFFTLPLVHTKDPATGKGNLGIYRMQRYDDASTGMHWQIEKGGGFHFERARQLGKPLPVSVFLGGPPALTLAAIAPMPEGVDERILAALMMGEPLEVIERSATGHKIPARAEFVLEGTVIPGDLRREGPFGDHLGHYSHSADFPVYRVDRVLARQDAIYPATVVGKPPQEDYFIGEALQEMALPLLRLLFPAVRDLWAYPETGFHPLAVAAVQERYGNEALKHAFSILGHGQISLSKILIVVDEDVNVRDFRNVSRAIWQHCDFRTDLFLLSPTAQDTLDFTGPSMNTGSRLVLLATRKRKQDHSVRSMPPPSIESCLHDDIIDQTNLGEAFLIAKVKPGADTTSIREALARHPAASQYPFHVLVSDDVPLDDLRLTLWGWFTRFDPLADLHPAGRRIDGNRLVLEGPILIDATWKEGYRKPVTFDPDVEKMVNQKWDRYGIGLA